MASVFARTGGQCSQNMRMPMLLILTEHIMDAVSGRPSPFGVFIMCSASIESSGLRILDVFCSSDSNMEVFAVCTLPIPIRPDMTDMGTYEQKHVTFTSCLIQVCLSIAAGLCLPNGWASLPRNRDSVCSSPLARHHYARHH